MLLGSSPNRRLTKDERQSPAMAEAAASAPSCHVASAQRIARAGYCFRRGLKRDGDGSPVKSPAGLVLIWQLWLRNSPAAQDVPRVSAVRRSLIVANCLKRSAALAGLS